MSRVVFDFVELKDVTLEVFINFGLSEESSLGISVPQKLLLIG